MFVDNAAMQIIRRPTDFDVIVTENMFGDILTDEASVISGSLGMLSSASIGAKCALFEPVHGSYPQAAGKDIANPMAAVLSAALLLEHLGLGAEGRAVRKAIDRTLAAGVVTEDLTAPGPSAATARRQSGISSPRRYERPSGSDRTTDRNLRIGTGGVPVRHDRLKKGLTGSVRRLRIVTKRAESE